MTIRTVARRKTRPVDDDPIDQHPDLVNVDIAEPHAVYFDGEQRTGTLTDVPYPLALTWLRQRWASFLWWK